MSILGLHSVWPGKSQDNPIMQRSPILQLLLAVILVSSCATSRKSYLSEVPAYAPASPALYDTIVALDSIWGDSYNNCRLDVQERIISEDLEFYHDKGGLLTSKSKLIDALRNNICGKVERELLRGSIEVYPIEGYGAVQMGYHRFYNNNEKSRSQYARFVHLWKNENGSFRITRVYSLH